jgi:chromosome segregation ATPase
MSDLNPYEEGLAIDLAKAQASIEALTEQLEAARADAKEAEAYAEELEKRVAFVEEERRKTFQALLKVTKIHDEVEAKLATCEKYRDAYAECDRIGTQAVRDLEAKLAECEARLGKAVDGLNYCINAPLSGWTIAQGYARTTLAEIGGLGVKQTG